MAHVKPKIKSKQIVASFMARFTRVKMPHELRLKDVALYRFRYEGLTDGLSRLPVPDSIKIGRRRYWVPQTMEQFSDTITYGQKMYFGRGGDDDIELAFRYICGYYMPLVTDQPWDEKNIIAFRKNIVNSFAIEVFPVALHLITLMAQLVERELKLLKREPTKQEKAAGIERMGKFAELMAVMFLTESFNCSENELMQKSYGDCLVRFMLQHEQNAFAERLANVYQKENESKIKKPKR